MAGKPYAKYHDNYRREMDKLSFVDSLDRAKAKVWIKEAAAIDKTREWPLLAQYIDISARFHELRSGKNAVTEEEAKVLENDLLAVARTAKREGFPHIKLIVLHDIAGVYRSHMLDYRMAFEYYLQLAACVQRPP